MGPLNRIRRIFLPPLICICVAGYGVPSFAGCEQVFATLSNSNAPFLLQVGEGTERRVMRPGDEVSLKSLVSLSKMQGTVEKTVVDDEGHLVGFYLQRKISPPPGGKHETDPELYWLSDFEASGSRIVASPPDATPNVQNATRVVRASSIVDPENTLPFTFHFANTEFQTPASIGDHIIISHLGRRQDGSPIELTLNGFVQRILRDEKNMPKAIEVRDQYSYSNPPRTVVMPFDQIMRVGGSTRVDAGNSFADSPMFKSVGSRIRQPWDESKSWHISGSSALAARKDSGHYTFRIGPEIEGSMQQAPISVGDEILVCHITPGTFLGYRFERHLVEDIIYDAHGNAIGFRGETAGKVGDSSKVYRFDQIDREESYIDTKPASFGKRANAVPGAYEKRERYVVQGGPSVKAAGGGKRSFEEILAGVSERRFKLPTQVEPWRDVPMEYEAWVKKYSLDPWDQRSKVAWARWVLRVSESDDSETIVKSFRRLVQSFHPDRNQDSALSAEALDQGTKQVLAAKRILFPK